jgi:hypothetical protein
MEVWLNTKMVSHKYIAKGKMEIHDLLIMGV